MHNGGVLPFLIGVSKDWQEEMGIRLVIRMGRTFQMERMVCAKWESERVKHVCGNKCGSGARRK